MRTPNPRRLRQGGVAAAITAAVVVILVLAVILADLLDERYLLRVDLTADQIFELSEQSKSYLENLEQEVNLYVLTTEQTLTTGDVYYLQVYEVLRQYGAYPGITVEYVDLARSPELRSRYPQYQLNSQTILLESGDRVTTVNLSELFNTEADYLDGAEYIVSSRAEETMTGAIMGLTVEDPVTAVMIEGFGEDAAEALESLLSANHYRVLRQNILLEEIDPAADLLVICAPMRDYTEAELRRLDSFLENGGELGKTLLYFADALQPETSNLNAFLADWGIEVRPGVIRENDANKRVTSSYFWSVAEYTENLYAADALAAGLYTMAPEARPIGILFEERGDLTVTAPLIFTETACIQPVDEQELEGWSAETAETGPFAALAVSTRAAGDQNDERYSHLAVASSSLMVEASVLQTPYVGNSEYILGLVSRLTGQDLGVTIAPKAIGLSYLPISDFQIGLWGTAFTILLPLLIVAAGAGVFLRRRHL